MLSAHSVYESIKCKTVYTLHKYLEPMTHVFLFARAQFTLFSELQLWHSAYQIDFLPR